MRYNEILSDAKTSLTQNQIAAVFSRLIKTKDALWKMRYVTKAKKLTPDEIKQLISNAAADVKLVGRTTKTWRSDYDAGNLHDLIVRLGRDLLVSANQSLDFPSGRENIARAFTDYLSQYFSSIGIKNIARSFYGRRWTVSSGGSHRDPQNGLEFFSEEDFNRAWETLKSRGKRIYLRGVFRSDPPQEYIKIGKFLLSQGGRVLGAFGNNPTYERYIYVQSASIMRNPLTPKLEISDQQAATLHDIAATRSATAIEKIKQLFGYLEDRDKIRDLISKSEKIAADDKAKLDAIIRGAKDFTDDES